VLMSDKRDRTKLLRVGAINRELRAEVERLRAENKQLTERLKWCGDCGEARADIPRCTVCTVEYVPRQAARQAAREEQMTKCDFCGDDCDPANDANVQVRDQNAFVASEYDACDPCAFGLVEVLEAYKAEKDSLRQVVDS
jgi:hypothetical protein